MLICYLSSSSQWGKVSVGTCWFASPFTSSTTLHYIGRGTLLLLLRQKLSDRYPFPTTAISSSCLIVSRLYSGWGSSSALLQPPALSSPRKRKQAASSHVASYPVSAAMSKSMVCVTLKVALMGHHRQQGYVPLITHFRKFKNIESKTLICRREKAFYFPEEKQRVITLKYNAIKLGRKQSGEGVNKP